MSNTNERGDLIAGLREHATFMCIEGSEKQRTLKAADMLEADLHDFESYSKIIKSATARERHTRETLRKLLANRQAQQVEVPDGYVLVPIEPTQEMISAGQDLVVHDTAYEDYRGVYKAMIAAAQGAKT